MPKLTIYLSDDLAAAVKDAGISVSPVCQRALEQEVRSMRATTIEDEDIAKAARRLAAEEKEEVTEARAVGRDSGRRWALHSASPRDLRGMEALTTREPLDNRIRIYGGEGVPWSELKEAPYASIRLWLEDAEPRSEESAEAWWDAFEDAALETYEKVQEAMRNATVPTEVRAVGR